MRTLFRVSFMLAVCASLFGALAIHAQDVEESDKDEKKERFSKEQKGVAKYVVNQLDGEEQMLVNGLRYLMRPRYEDAVMEGLAFDPCPLPSFDDEVDAEMSLPECMRLWAILRSGWEFEENLQREFSRFMATEHERYNESLAAYAVPMAVCTVALRRGDIEKSEDFEEALREEAEDLMELGMKVRDLTDPDSPNIKGMVINPAWYANHLWRALMARCALELDIDFNENVWESDLKHLSHSAQKELGWISTQGKGMTPDNDLNSNLLALAAISLALSAPEDAVGKNVRRSLEKRLKYLEEILSRLEDDWPDELRTGGRLCLVRTLDPEFGPKGVKPFDWRFGIRKEAVENMFASGAVYTDHKLIREMGLYGGTNRRYAKDACETALACLSICGGIYPDRPKETLPPLEGSKTEDLKLVMESLSLLHASVLPERRESDELAARVEQAIDLGCEWLIEIQNSDGTFSEEDAKYRNQPGEVGLATLALLYGGVDREHEAIESALAFLMGRTNAMLNNPQGKGKRYAFTGYDAGILLMMFQKYYLPEMEEAGVFETETQPSARAARKETWNSLAAAHRQMIERLVKFLDSCWHGEPHGGWRYTPVSQRGTTGGDNSVSQYAGCGYKSAAMLGAPVDIEIMEAESRMLIEQYVEDRSFDEVEYEELRPAQPAARNDGRETADERYRKGGRYEYRQRAGKVRPGGWTYGRSAPRGGKALKGRPRSAMTGTGMALLAGFRDELWARNELDKDLHRDMDMHLFGAQAWIAAMVEKDVELEPELEDDEEPADDGRHMRASSWRMYYDYYAIERGCVMAGFEILSGGVGWYRILATEIVNAQQPSGTWGDVLGTAMAILVLRRAAPPSVTQPPMKGPLGDPVRNPVTEREKYPTTPGPVKPEKDHAGDPPEGEEEDEPASPITPGPGDD